METMQYRALSDIPLVMRVEDLMPILFIGRNAAYDLVRSGQIESFRIGKQIRITKDAVCKYLGLHNADTYDILKSPLHGEITGAARKE